MRKTLSAAFLIVAASSALSAKAEPTNIRTVEGQYWQQTGRKEYASNQTDQGQQFVDRILSENPCQNQFAFAAQAAASKQEVRDAIAALKLASSLEKKIIEKLRAFT